MLHVLFLVSLFAARLVSAHEIPKVEMPKEFDTLKKLVGTWEGTTKEEGKEEKISAVYELTSGGTAIMEKLNPGTPHEMVSIYHKAGKTLSMTHYCALGNAPQMPLKKSTDSTIAFEMTKPVGVTSLKEPHMHGVTLTMKDADTLEQAWTHFVGGKKKGDVIFTLTRKKA